MTFLQKKRRPKLLVLGGGIKIIQQEKILRVFIKYVFPLKIGYVESKLSFLRTFLRFHNALTTLEPQIYVFVERFWGGKYPSDYFKHEIGDN